MTHSVGSWRTLPSLCRVTGSPRWAGPATWSSAFRRWSAFRRGLAVLPGFINAHTHTALTVLRGTVEDLDSDAVYGYMSPVSYEMSDEERAIMVQLGCLEAIRSGCATLVDPFRHLHSYVPAMAATGLRLWVSESCADINTLKIRQGDYTVDRAFGQVFLDRAIRVIENFHGAYDDRVRCQIAAHAPDNCSPWMLDQLMQLARRHGLTRTMHLAQSIEEVPAVKAAYGLPRRNISTARGFWGRTWSPRIGPGARRPTSHCWRRAGRRWRIVRPTPLAADRIRR